jgi:hypothetical protein
MDVSKPVKFMIDVITTKEEHYAFTKFLKVACR